MGLLMRFEIHLDGTLKSASFAICHAFAVLSTSIGLLCGALYGAPQFPSSWVGTKLRL